MKRLFYVLSRITCGGVLLCALAGAIFGCGSNESQPVTQQEKKSATTLSGKPQLKETILSGNRGASAPSVPLRGGADLDKVEVLPPTRPGERGTTLAEVKAKVATAQPVDPALIEVVPPKKPGERGLTRAELRAMAGSTVRIDPALIEVVPPNKPGERGLTRAELRAMAGSTVRIDPALIEVVPPNKPGERGLTRAELKVTGAGE